MCTVDATEFTSVCFWIELLQFLVREKYHSLESLYEFHCLACSVLSISSECVFPILVSLIYLQYIIKGSWTKLNRNTLHNVFDKKA
jgi:hypothetical protein